MIRKLMGASLLLAVLSLIACGNNTSNVSDECDEDPSAPNCVAPADDEPAQE